MLDIFNVLPILSPNIDIIIKNGILTDDIKKQINISNITDSHFVPICSKKYLNKCDKIMQISLENINIMILYKNNINDILRYINVLKRCVIITKIEKINKNFNIFIVKCPNKRTLPSNIIDYITPDNINGGFTSLNTTNIFILREEEFPKVILHEILHHSQYHIDNWGSYNINKLKKHFNIDKRTVLIPNEAIIETIATIYHLSFISSEYNIPYDKLLKKEIKYSIKQSNKILDRQEKQLLNNIDNWYENTNAYCYIIFKTILLIKLTDLNKIKDTKYLTNILIDNKNIIPRIKIKNTDKSLRIMSLSDY